MTALTLLAKWTASSSSWKKYMNDLLYNLNIFSMSHLKMYFFSDSRHLGLCQAHKPNVTCRAVPAGPGECRPVCHYSVPKRNSVVSGAISDNMQHEATGLARAGDASAPTTSVSVWGWEHTDRITLEEMGSLEQGWGLVYLGSENYCEFTEDCLNCRGLKIHTLQQLPCQD